MNDNHIQLTIDELEKELREIDINRMSIIRVIELLKDMNPIQTCEKKKEKKKTSNTEGSGKNLKTTKKESGEEVVTGKNHKKEKSTTETISENTCEIIPKENLKIDGKFETVVKDMLNTPPPKGGWKAFFKRKKEEEKLASEKINVVQKNTQKPHKKSTKTIKDVQKEVKQKHNLPIGKDVVGYMCDECGETYEEKPERCIKCSSYSIEILEREKEMCKQG